MAPVLLLLADAPQQSGRDICWRKDTESVNYDSYATQQQQICYNTSGGGITKSFSNDAVELGSRYSIPPPAFSVPPFS